MAEPAASTSAAIAIAFGTVTVSGSLLGIQYDALLAGFFGGLVSLSVLPPMSNWKIAGSVVCSALLAGFFAPLCAAAALNFLPWLSAVSELTRLACAVVIGICWQPILPAGLSRLRSVIGSGGRPQ